MVATANELNVRLIWDREAELTRVFNAPRDLPWKGDDGSGAHRQWWGPRWYATAVDKMDVRIGWKWRLVNRDTTDSSEHCAAAATDDLRDADRTHGRMLDALEP